MNIVILLPILGDVVCELFPRRCLGLTCFWPFFLHFVLKASKLERRPYLPQPSTLPSLGVIDEVASLVEERLRVLAHASEQSSSGRASLG